MSQRMEEPKTVSECWDIYEKFGFVTPKLPTDDSLFPNALQLVRMHNAHLDEIGRLTKERDTYRSEARNERELSEHIVVEREELIIENERLTKEYAEERAAHNAHVAELLEAEKLIKQFTKERDAFKVGRDNEVILKNEVIRKYEELEEANSAMREALEWYGDDANYKLGPNCGLGERARAVLAKIEEGEKP